MKGDQNYAKQRIEGLKRFGIELIPVAGLIAFGMLLLAIVPDWQQIPYGFIRIGCVIAGGMLLRCYWDTTISNYIYRGGFKNDFTMAKGDTKVIISIVVKLIYACIAAACFIL